MTERPKGDIAGGFWDFAQGTRLRKGEIDFAKLYATRSSQRRIRRRTCPREPREKPPRTVGGHPRGDIKRSAAILPADRVIRAAVKLEDELPYDETEPLPFAARHWLGAARSRQSVSPTLNAYTARSSRIIRTKGSLLAQAAGRRGTRPRSSRPAKSWPLESGRARLAFKDLRRPGAPENLHLWAGRPIAAGTEKRPLQRMPTNVRPLPSDGSESGEISARDQLCVRSPLIAGAAPKWKNTSRSSQRPSPW